MMEREYLLKGYNSCKVNRRQRLTTTVVFSLIFSLTALIGGALILHEYNTLPPLHHSLPYTTNLNHSISALCSLTHNPLSCFTAISDGGSRTEWDCASLFGDSLSQLVDSTKVSLTTEEKDIDGARITNQEDCLGVLERMMMGSTVGDEVIRAKVHRSKVNLSNSLLMLSKMQAFVDEFVNNPMSLEYRICFSMFWLEFLIIVCLFCLLLQIK